jgi:putative transposase
MRSSRFTEEQIIGILGEQEAGVKTADVCCKHGISSATFYKWKAKYGGLEVPDAKRLKALEDENAKLKKLLAEAELDKAMLKEIASKNVWSAPSVQGSSAPIRNWSVKRFVDSTALSLSSWVTACLLYFGYPHAQGNDAESAVNLATARYWIKFVHAAQYIFFTPI